MFPHRNNWKVKVLWFPKADIYHPASPHILTAPIPPPVSHSYNDDADGGPNIVSSDTEADPKSVFFSFVNLRFYLKANVAAGIPTWRCNQGEKENFSLNFLF